MNKKGQISFKRITAGVSIGIIGFIIMAFGSALNNIWMLRGGIVAVTFATWMVSWE